MLSLVHIMDLVFASSCSVIKLCAQYEQKISFSNKAGFKITFLPNNSQSHRKEKF